MSALPTKSTRVVDGTTTWLICYLHDFKTEDPLEFDKHMIEGEGHYEHGQAPCFVCGEIYYFKAEDKTVQSKHVKRGYVMHPACKKRFITEHD